MSETTDPWEDDKDPDPDMDQWPPLDPRLVPLLEQHFPHPCRSAETSLAQDKWAGGARSVVEFLRRVHDYQHQPR